MISGYNKYEYIKSELAVHVCYFFFPLVPPFDAPLYFFTGTVSACACRMAPRLKQKSTCELRPWLSVSRVRPHIGHCCDSFGITRAESYVVMTVCVDFGFTEVGRDDDGFVDGTALVLWGLVVEGACRLEDTEEDPSASAFVVFSPISSSSKSTSSSSSSSQSEGIASSKSRRFSVAKGSLSSSLAFFREDSGLADAKN